MQRHQALRNLSSDHHTGLVLARKARDAAGRDSRHQVDTWLTVVVRFRDELEPHFRLEESGLLPAMLRAGETGLVERTLREHTALRLLVAENHVEDLSRFAELLTAHIRFEEKELFETAQRLLNPDTLAMLAQQQIAGTL